MAVKDQDRESVGDFYGVSMDILSKSIHLQQATSVSEEDSKFSITPKKIKIVRWTNNIYPENIYLIVLIERAVSGPKQTYRFVIRTVKTRRSCCNHYR